MKEYDAGATAYIEVEIRDRSDVLMDPGSVTVDIFDPGGASLSTGQAAKDSTGKYHYTYAVPVSAASGSTYTTKATVVNSEGLVTVKRARFKVR